MAYNSNIIRTDLKNAARLQFATTNGSCLTDAPKKFLIV
jgi:hypothetical protein